MHTAGVGHTLRQFIHAHWQQRLEVMKQEDIREQAFAMPITSPAYPRGPYRFVDRKFLIITYRGDPDRLRATLPPSMRR